MSQKLVNIMTLIEHDKMNKKENNKKIATKKHI